MIEVISKKRKQVRIIKKDVVNIHNYQIPEEFLSDSCKHLGDRFPKLDRQI